MTIKKALARGVWGALLGIGISYTITILISIGLGTGEYSPVVPELIQNMGTELNAVIFQYFMSAILGFTSVISSAIYEIERWSLAKQTILHFLILSVSMISVAYLCKWVSLNVWSVILYFAIFVFAYFIIWAILCRIWRKRVDEMNAKLKDM